MEPLAARIRQHHTNRGVGFSSRGLTILHYADDLTLYITDPVNNILPMLQELTKFGGISGIHTY